nr:reverse transcriptase domain-containing protein [Tanacetum cinerariifolium]
MKPINNEGDMIFARLAISSGNAQSAVTYTSISFNSDGPSWGILLMNAGELPEIDPYDEEHEPEDDDEDPKEDPNEEHDPEDEDTKEPSEDSDETESFEEDETAALIDAFAIGSPPFRLPPTIPAYDQAPLGHRATMIRMRDDILEEDIPPRRRFVLTAPQHGCDVEESSAAVARAPRGQYDFVDTVEAGQGLIRSPGHDARTIARAANRAKDVGYVRALQAWDRYKDLLRACPHHGFTELHQFDTFYNALNPADQYSLNSVAGGNLLERRTQDVLTIIENKSKCMRTRSSSNLPVESSPNPSTSNPRRRNRRRSKQPFILEEPPVDTMVDQRTMAELLCAPTEGYAEAIVVPPVLAEQFELKHSLVNMMTSDQFFGLEKDNPHDHIRWFNKITSTIKYKDVPNSAINLMLFPFSLARVARRTTNLRNKISNFQQRFDESFHEAWDRYKDLLRACLYHGFTELHQLDTFYNALNPAGQDSLNSATGGNLLERRTQDVLTIIENKSKVCNSRNKSVVSQVKSSDANSNSSSEIAKLTHAVNQQMSVVTTTMTAILKQFQATPPPAFVKAVEEICITCGGAHSFRISLPSNIIANPKGELKAITTRSGIVLDGPSVPIPPLFINPEKDERVEETLTDQDLAEYTIKVSPPLIQKPKPSSQRNFAVHQRDPLHPNIPYPSRMLKKKQQEKDKKMLKALLSNKEKLLELANTPLNKNYSAVILKKFLEKLGDPGKFLILYGFSELKCKALADLGASINLMPIFVWKKLEGCNVLTKKLLDLDSIKDLHPLHHINQLNSSTTSASPNRLLEEFANELALIAFPLEYDDDLPFDIESDLKEIEYLLHHDPIKDMDSILEDSIDEGNLADLNDNLGDTMPEMFTEEHALDYSSPPLYDEYDDDLFEVESDTEYVYDHPFDYKGEKIKELKLFIDELDLPSDFLPSSEYDSFLSEDFVNQQTSDVTTAMMDMLKQLQANPPPAPVKVVEEICFTCGGAHLYYQCLAAGGNTFPEFRDNIQGYVSAAASNYNQEVNERVEETYTDPDLAEYTIKVPPPPV